MTLRTPMLKMIDSLKAEELSTRRAAEAWMRCSLKSYIRSVKPIPTSSAHLLVVCLRETKIA